MVSQVVALFPIITDFLIVDTTVQNPYSMVNFKIGYNYLDFSSGWPVLTS